MNKYKAILNKINEINYKNNIMILSNDNKEENIIQKNNNIDKK